MSDKRATADRYAQAVLEAMVERWQSTLDSVAAAVAGDRKLAALLADPDKSADEKNKAQSTRRCRSAMGAPTKAQ